MYTAIIGFLNDILYRPYVVPLILLAAGLSAGIVWDTADALQGLMVVINIPVIVILAKPAFAALEDYVKQRNEGKNPVYVASDCGIKEETDFWKA